MVKDCRDFFFFLNITRIKKKKNYLCKLYVMKVTDNSNSGYKTCRSIYKKKILTKQMKN